jgi:hypothetical protein
MLESSPNELALRLRLGFIPYARSASRRLRQRDDIAAVAVRRPSKTGNEHKSAAGNKRAT